MLFVCYTKCSTCRKARKFLEERGVDVEVPKAVAEVLGLPEQVHPFNIIALGYPDEQKAEVDRFDPAKVHYEKW